MTRKFSVVIPTLQLSPLLPDVLRTYDAHPRLGDIPVVNNARSAK